MAETWVKGNRYLSQSQMQNNALIIRDWIFHNDTYSDKSLAALLGNMQQESTINPGIWQSLKPGAAGGGGWGLVQWTPWTNFTTWAANNGYASDDGYAQLIWIRDMTIPFGQWIQTSAYPISFHNWKENDTHSVTWLTRAFCRNFERGVEGNRVKYANEWADWLGTDPDEPDTPVDPDDPDNPYPKPENIRRHMPIMFYMLPWQ